MLCAKVNYGSLAAKEKEGKWEARDVVSSHFDKTEQETFHDPQSEQLGYQQNARCQLITHSNHNPP